MKKLAFVSIIMLFRLLHVEADGADFAVSYDVSDYPVQKIITSLQSGHRSEVRYEMRVLKEVSGFRRIFGDTLILRREVARVARWDAMNQLFVVVVDGAQEFTFDDQKSFLAYFLSLADYRFTLDPQTVDGAYVLCRTRIQPIKLVPPLTLMTLIKSDLQLISEWRRVQMRQVAQ